MSNDKLVLADGTEIMLESAAGVGELNVLVETKDAACAVWKDITPEKLKQVNIQNEAGEITGHYENMVLDHITGTDHEKGVLIILSLRQKSREEILEERIALLESGQQTQDAAIVDLGQAVSDMAEGGVQ